jgi:hypothetical protein
MTDKQKLLEYIERYTCDLTSFEDMVEGFMACNHKEFSAWRINNLIEMLHKLLKEEIDKNEMVVRVAHERATYLKCYLEGKMYESEEVARECVGLQIENAKAILDSTERVAL